MKIRITVVEVRECELDTDLAWWTGKEEDGGKPVTLKRAEKELRTDARRIVASPADALLTDWCVRPLLGAVDLRVEIEDLDTQEKVTV